MDESEKGTKDIKNELKELNRKLEWFEDKKTRKKVDKNDGDNKRELKALKEKISTLKIVSEGKKRKSKVENTATHQEGEDDRENWTEDGRQGTKEEKE